MYLLPIQGNSIQIGNSWVVIANDHEIHDELSEKVQLATTYSSWQKPTVPHQNMDSDVLVCAPRISIVS